MPPESRSSVQFLEVNLRLAVAGPPVLHDIDDMTPRPHRFVTMVPTGGKRTDARLFALCRTEGDTVVRFGVRGRAATSKDMLVCMPVSARDPRLGARLWERGEHAGDILVPGASDDDGRPQRMTLIYLDLSKGFTPDYEVTLPLEVRRALAATAELLAEEAWRQTAEVLDPGRLLREAHLNADRDVFTLDGAIAAVRAAEATEDAAFDASKNPMPDFRFRTDQALIDELRNGGRVLKTGRPDLKFDDGMIGTVCERLPELAELLERNDRDGAERLGGQIRWMLTRAQRLSEKAAAADSQGVETANRMLVSGRGAGAVFFRDLFAENGMLDTMMRRVREPGIDEPLQAVVARLESQPHGRRLAALAVEPISIDRHVVTRTDALRSALRSTDIPRRVPILAVNDPAILAGQSLRQVLQNAWQARPVEMRQLAGRSAALAQILEGMTALGSCDPHAAIAARSLRHGIDALERSRPEADRTVTPAASRRRTQAPGLEM